MLAATCLNQSEDLPKEEYKSVIVDTTVIEPNPVVLAQNEVRETKNWDKNCKDDTIQITYEEAQLLMRIATAEAGNQGVEGMCLVMQTVWNRVQSPLYPDTVWEVISQPYQFEAITNGTYYTVDIPAEAHEALAMFEGNLSPNNDIVAFETVTNGSSLLRYYDESFTYREHTFYTKKKD